MIFVVAIQAGGINFVYGLGDLEPSGLEGGILNWNHEKISTIDIGAPYGGNFLLFNNTDDRILDTRRF